MSRFENYEKVSQFYDVTRVPVGLDIIREAIVNLNSSFGKLYLLDAGCGTGAYIVGLLPYVDFIKGIDLNTNMLAKSQEKLALSTARAQVSFELGSVKNIPLKDGTANAVMINQVLHHLGDSHLSGWTDHRVVFRECSRILKPGGLLILNSCSHQQLDRGFWFYSLISEAREKVKEFVPSDNQLSCLLNNAGFKVVDKTIPYEEVLQGEDYFLPKGILDPSWRSGDSIWSLVSDSSLQGVLYKIEELMISDDLNDFMHDGDRHRLDVGQTTFTMAQKPL